MVVKRETESIWSSRRVFPNLHEAARPDNRSNVIESLPIRNRSFIVTPMRTRFDAMLARDPFDFLRHRGRHQNPRRTFVKQRQFRRKIGGKSRSPRRFLRAKHSASATASPPSLTSCADSASRH